MSQESHEDAELQKLQEQIHKGAEETKTYLASVRPYRPHDVALGECSNAGALS